MSKADVTIFLKSTVTILPECAKRAKSLDQIAACAIFDGLLAYGWTWAELLPKPTLLIVVAIKYLDHKTLEEYGVPTIQYSRINLADANRYSKKKHRSDIGTDGMKHKRTHKLYSSNQGSFGSSNQTAYACLAPSDSSAQNQCPMDCSPDAAGWTPPNEAVFNKSGQSNKKTSASDILDFVATTNTEGFQMSGLGQRMVVTRYPNMEFFALVKPSIRRLGIRFLPGINRYKHTYERSSFNVLLSYIKPSPTHLEIRSASGNCGPKHAHEGSNFDIPLSYIK